MNELLSFNFKFFLISLEILLLGSPVKIIWLITGYSFKLITSILFFISTFISSKKLVEFRLIKISLIFSSSKFFFISILP